MSNDRLVLAKRLILGVVAGAGLMACRQGSAAGDKACDPSITLPPGFCASIFADSVGPARHIVVRRNGDVIVGILDQRRQKGGVLLLRDQNKDGRADMQGRVGDMGVHGVAFAGDSSLLVSTATAVLRFQFTDSLLPSRKPQTILTGLVPRTTPSHSLAVDLRHRLIVAIGANSEGCAPKGATTGLDPCPEREVSGGIWAFLPDRPNQTMRDGVRLATGLRDPVALAVNPRDTMIYAVTSGRAGLHDAFPSLYSPEEAATIPADELVRIQSSRADFGWPYCYYDYLKQERVLAPEYGGDKTRTDRCDRLIQPLVAFPAHWSPMAMVFYTGQMFPAEYQGGAFIAFHGSSQRAPLAEEGYQVVFQQFKDGLAADYVIFAKGFAGASSTATGAAHRPSGIAQGPDGALYVSDDRGGRIWRITYKGQ